MRFGEVLTFVIGWGVSKTIFVIPATNNFRILFNQLQLELWSLCKKEMQKNTWQHLPVLKRYNILSALQFSSERTKHSRCELHLVPQNTVLSARPQYKPTSYCSAMIELQVDELSTTLCFCHTAPYCPIVCYTIVHSTHPLPRQWEGQARSPTTSARLAPSRR